MTVPGKTFPKKDKRIPSTLDKYRRTLHMKKSMTALVIVVLLLSITLFSCSNRTPEAAVAYVDYADGSEETDTLIIKNGKVTLPRSPQRDGYDFDGWLVNGTLYKYPSSASVQNGTTITAKWTKLCTVTVKYHIDGVADSSETVRSGESYTLPPDFRTSGGLNA